MRVKTAIKQGHIRQFCCQFATGYSKDVVSISQAKPITLRVKFR